MLHFDLRGSRRPPLHTHTPRTLVRTLHQGPTQNVTPSPKCRNKPGKLLGFGFSALLKPVPWRRGTQRSRTPLPGGAVAPPGPSSVDNNKNHIACKFSIFLFIHTLIVIGFFFLERLIRRTHEKMGEMSRHLCSFSFHPPI